MSYLVLVLVAAASFGAGFFVYGNLLKHNPEKLARWLAEAQLAQTVGQSYVDKVSAPAPAPEPAAAPAP